MELCGANKHTHSGPEHEPEEGEVKVRTPQTSGAIAAQAGRGGWTWPGRVAVWLSERHLTSCWEHPSQASSPGGTRLCQP